MSKMSNLLMPSLAWGVYCRTKFIDSVANDQRHLYGRGFPLSLHSGEQIECGPVVGGGTDKG